VHVLAPTKTNLAGIFALALLCLTACYTAFKFLESLTEDVYNSADVLRTSTWTVSDTPTVTVATFCGAIFVHPGGPRTVRIVFRPSSSCKNKSVTDAERSLTAVDVQMTRDGDTIRAFAKRVGDPVALCSIEASVDVYIPTGTRLIVETNAGSMLITGAPSEIIAKNNFGAFGADFVVGPESAALTGDTAAKLAVVRGSLYVDGQRRAKVSPGDRIKLTGDGELFVNGELYTPADGGAKH
jgi:hypothetical protein